MTTELKAFCQYHLNVVQCISLETDQIEICYVDDILLFKKDKAGEEEPKKFPPKGFLVRDISTLLKVLATHID